MYYEVKTLDIVDSLTHNAVCGHLGRKLCFPTIQLIETCACAHFVSSVSSHYLLEGESTKLNFRKSRPLKPQIYYLKEEELLQQLT